MSITRKGQKLILSGQLETCAEACETESMECKESANLRLYNTYDPNGERCNGANCKEKLEELMAKAASNSGYDKYYNTNGCKKVTSKKKGQPWDWEYGHPAFHWQEDSEMPICQIADEKGFTCDLPAKPPRHLLCLCSEGDSEEWDDLDMDDLGQEIGAGPRFSSSAFALVGAALLAAFNFAL